MLLLLLLLLCLYMPAACLQPTASLRGFVEDVVLRSSFSAEVADRAAGCWQTWLSAGGSMSREGRDTARSVMDWQIVRSPIWRFGQQAAANIRAAMTRSCQRRPGLCH